MDILGWDDAYKTIVFYNDPVLIAVVYFLIQQLLNRRRAAVAAGTLALAGIFAGVQAAQSPNETSVAIKRDPQPVVRGSSKVRASPTW